MHLAAVSFPPDATQHPEGAWRINLCGTLNVFESVRVSGLSPRILFIGSSDEYGHPAPERIPITESCPLSPVNVYGSTKAAGDMAAAFFAERHGLDIVRVRPFNHTGPGQSPRFVCSDFARQVAEAKVRPDSKKTMSVGNLEARRDFSDVRDIVRAYLCALERGVKGEVYNIASGSAVQIGDMLAKLMDIAGVKIEITQDPARLRSTDVPLVVGDSSKFRRATGWKPQIPFDQTLRDLFEYWREQLSTG
jgi:GDP-4-dehydro-6-deoxy-D-mannose reductase